MTHSEVSLLMQRTDKWHVICYIVYCTDSGEDMWYGSVAVFAQRTIIIQNATPFSSLFLLSLSLALVIILVWAVLSLTVFV